LTVFTRSELISNERLDYKGSSLEAPGIVLGRCVARTVLLEGRRHIVQVPSFGWNRTFKKYLELVSTREPFLPDQAYLDKSNTVSRGEEN
jgi:hypothetical protein